METAEFENERCNPIVEEVGSMAGTSAVPDMRLELVPIPVSNIDRAKAFYEQVGFGNLHDTQVTDTMRVVQLTPPGSSCAIVFGTGMGPITDMAPGSVKGLHLVVDDMAATRTALAERGVNSATSTIWAASSTRISAIRTETCGRCSSGLRVTRPSRAMRIDTGSARGLLRLGDRTRTSRRGP